MSIQPTTAERERFEEYGQMMFDAGMDAGSYFWDRNKSGAEKKQEAAELLNELLATPPATPAAQAGASDLSFLQWVTEWFGPDADEEYVRRAIASLPSQPKEPK